METEYASNSKGNTGVTLGAIGTGLSILNGLGNGGILGCCGGGAVRTAGALAEGQLCAGLMAEVQGLKAEKYAWRNTADVYAALNNQNNTLRDKISNIEKWQAAEMAAAPLREQLLRQRIEFLECTVRHITSVGVPNGVLVPGVPAVQVVHPAATPAVQA